ncbi:DUF4232 domain-containing protein [Streptomyces sp. NBC_00876]|uniref:DUF4232 domain-containing protein n=1 Tax=Streptomyces sp. NBC_00876 TaxID=2975853 RepID=UPI00386E6A97|nr:DUF4232 domain-containing protein [Streptomyces sp. NBC_00876]
MRPSPSLALCTALAGTMLLAGCGQERGVGSGAPSGSGSPTCTATLPATGPDGGTWENVTLISRGCGASPAPATEFEVTNTGKEPLTFTITFDRMNEAGEVMDNTSTTVASVRPGRTVRRTLDTGDTLSTAPASRVRVSKVRAVAADEAPATTGACPPSGVQVTADRGDAAMGLRVVGLHLVNCGSTAYRVNGYPGLQLLARDREPVTGVRILHGTDAISTGIGGDATSRPVTLKPGESAYANLAWRNTTGAGEAVNAPYVRVTPKPGAAAVTVTPELDLGTTGKLGVGPWTKDETAAR